MLKLNSGAGLFAVCVLIWGSTWIGITYQLGEVEPILSVAYRYTIAAFVLGVYCWWNKLSLRLPLSCHLLMAMVGLALYTLDYTLLYESEKYLVSAIVALMSSSIVYFNVLLRRFLLGKPIRPEVLVGASVGLIGMILIFMPEFDKVEASDKLTWGIALAMTSFVCAAIGNVISEKILDRGTPVVQMNFWAMSYGLVFMYSYVLLFDVEWRFVMSWDYGLSLVYLALFGSVLAFGAYMKLVQQMGADKAAYVILMYPVVALLLSVAIEGYELHWQVFPGMVIILAGSAIAMGKIPLGLFKGQRQRA